MAQVQLKGITQGSYHYTEVEDFLNHLRQLLDMAPESLTKHTQNAAWRGTQIKTNYDKQINLVLSRAGEEATVRINLRDNELREEKRFDLEDGGVFVLCDLGVNIGWCSSWFSLTRATVHLQLHQEAVQFAAQIMNGFEGPIGYVVPLIELDWDPQDRHTLGQIVKYKGKRYRCILERNKKNGGWAGTPSNPEEASTFWERIAE